MKLRRPAQHEWFAGELQGLPLIVSTGIAINRGSRGVTVDIDSQTSEVVSFHVFGFVTGGIGWSL